LFLILPNRVNAAHAVRPRKKNIIFLHIQFLSTLFDSHFDASARQTPDTTGAGGELFEKFQQKQKIIKDNSSVGGGQMGGKR
jgi:hypothetical protein